MIRVGRFGSKYLFALLGLSLLFGCGKGGNRASVSGSVMLDGKPLEQGAILFTPLKDVEGGPTGGQMVGGRYTIPSDKGPAIGLNRVEITAVKKSGKMVQNPMGPKGQMVEMEVSAVAPRDTGPASTLKFEIKPGDNHADFEVQAK